MHQLLNGEQYKIRTNKKRISNNIEHFKKGIWDSSIHLKKELGFQSMLIADRR